MHGIKDRRSSLRVEIEGEAVVYTERDVLEGRCLDLGREGIAIRSTRATRAKTPVTLELYLQGQRLRTEAVLVRRKRHQGDYIMGFRFIEVDRETSAAIDRLIFGRLAVSAHAEMLLAFAAHHAAVHGHGHGHGHGQPPPPAIESPDPPLVPVISGHTQVVSVEHLARPPIVDRTVIAPPPSRVETAGAGTEPVPSPPPAAEEAGVPEDAWFEDEMDTSKIRLLEAAVDPDLALDPEPSGEVPVDDTVVVPTGDEPGNEPVVTADHTEIVVTGDEPGNEPVVTADHTEIVVTTPVVPEGPPTATVPRLGPGGPPSEGPRTATIPLLDSGEPSSEGPRTATIPLLDLVGRPPEGPPTATVPLLPPSVAASVSASTPGGDAVASAGPPAAPRSPIQQALHDAMALLGPGSTPRRGPRVIVSIPHQTYRRQISLPWNP